MDRKKQLLMKYKYRKPEMGIISFLCIPTKVSFIGFSQDTKAYINSNCFKLGANLHRNSELQTLWNQYGESAFETGVLEVLPYDEKDKEKEDYTKELEGMCNRYLRTMERARRI
ncbi:MAG TPA: GIY-YIG nuclease family protein [Desulfitobacterium dehalogenans]|uniref:GIY-YIG nuclease family protein n=1 Tax=Desulfitobacterium dehalogenans TaxID=36854 RepID=A0A7C7D7L0_9FIRM|nr:GIY-YIG nuclease family protein [Desulfitobacterium dehalogenans]